MLKHNSIDGFTSQPIIQQDLKRCRLRSVPSCTSTLFLFLSMIYFAFFGYFGLYNANLTTYEVRYDDVCGNNMTCFVNFTIDHNFTGSKIGLYYKITNFTQNRVEIADSYSIDMLIGNYANDITSCNFRKYLNDKKKH